MMQKNWQVLTPSEFGYELAAFDFLRAGLPDLDPHRAWSNFEFVSQDGALYEVNALVLTTDEFWPIEVKSRPGRLEGDAGVWTWTTTDGRKVTTDNPVHLANKKVKILSSLLKAQPALRSVRLPFLEPLVFLAADDLDGRLASVGETRVWLPDRPAIVNTILGAESGFPSGTLGFVLLRNYGDVSCLVPG